MDRTGTHTQMKINADRMNAAAEPSDVPVCVSICERNGKQKAVLMSISCESVRRKAEP
jgi:hypothetical protein